MEKLSKPRIIDTGLEDTPPREETYQVAAPFELPEESDDGWKSEDFSDDEENDQQRPKQSKSKTGLRLPSIKRAPFRQGGPVVTDPTKYEILCKSAAAKLEENRKKKNRSITKGKYYTKEEEEIMEWYNIGPHVPTPPDSMINDVFHRNLRNESDLTIAVSFMQIKAFRFTKTRSSTAFAFTNCD